MMHQQTLFGSELEAAFLEFHEANPRVWELFASYAWQLIRAGRRHYSARAVIHRIRWHMDVETVGGDGFKINNNHSPYYARMFRRKFPLYGAFFHVREVKE